MCLWLGDLTSIGVTLVVGLLGLVFVAYLARKILKKDPGNEKMQMISESIHQGAMAFLKRE